MAFFFRRKNTDPPPEWTSFANMSEFEEFIGLVRKYFDKKAKSYTIEGELLTIKDENWPFSRMGLVNLAQLCKQNPRSAWGSIVNDHFDGMVRGKQFEEDFYARAHDYQYAAPYIGVRVYPNDYLAHVGDEATIKIPIAEDLSAMLILDLPHAVSNLKPETTIQWNKTNEELYEIGMANIRRTYTSEVIAEEVGGVKIYFIGGEHFFVANSVLDLHLRPVPIGTYGCLIGIPHRHTVLVYPIETLELTEALHPFLVVLRGMHKDGPGSISESLYWYRDGQLTNLPYTLDAEELGFSPPEEFFEMMNQLPPKK